MEASLFNQNGKAVAYLAADGKTIYLWDGRAAAYLAGPRFFGVNGRQLGWFDNGTFFDIFGLRAGFLKSKSPIPTDIEPVKPAKKAPSIRKPRQGGLAKPTLCYGYSNYFLEEILLEGLEG
ncbi:MAG: 4-fold beta flower protein [Desulfobaccales bacterium]